MRKKDMFTLGNLYGEQLNSLRKNLNESTGPGGKSLDDKDAGKVEKGGPSTKGGYKKALHDEDEECEDGDDMEKPKPFEKKKKKVVKESRKNANQTLNTSMKKQSAFDRLYTKVLNENWGIEDAEDDIGALGLGDATPDSDLTDDFGGEDDMGGEGEEVTITLDKATAQTLIDLLQGAIGGGEGEDEFGGEGEIDGDEDGGLDFGGEDDTEEDNEEMDFEEDEETYGTKTNAPDKKTAFQGKNNKVGGKIKPSSKKASSEVTDDVGDDGDFGHAITSPKKVNDGKNNKVGNLTKGADFFKN
jgi:hypothetical protein